MFSNCAYTFDVPLGTSNLVLNSGASTANLPNLGNMNFAADTYYFIALVGTQANPQIFTYSFSGSSISNMLSSANGSNNSSSTGNNGSGSNGTSNDGSNGSGNNGNNGSGSNGSSNDGGNGSGNNGNNGSGDGSGNGNGDSGSGSNG